MEKKFKAVASILVAGEHYKPGATIKEIGAAESRYLVGAGRIVEIDQEAEAEKPKRGRPPKAD